MNTSNHAPVRQRLSYADRHAQLLDVARELIRDEGTDALTLARIAERAGVTKPLVYDHFGTRSRVFAELYSVFTERQITTLENALLVAPTSLPIVARIIADAYIGCAADEGAELPGIVGALAASPELEQIRRDGERRFGERCQAALMPFVQSGKLPDAVVDAMFGAAESLTRSLYRGQLTAEGATSTLVTVVTALAEQH